MTTIGPETVVVATRRHLSAGLDGEAVILGLDSSLYFGLNEVGARIWSHLETPISIAELEARITAEYDVSPDRARNDIVELVNLLHGQGLVELS
jgi:Coenzyme PQQ synthesis protein D (PqqD)